MEPFCADTQRLAQQFYGRAVSLLDRAAWPLVQQAITFQARVAMQVSFAAAKTPLRPWHLTRSSSCN